MAQNSLFTLDAHDLEVNGDAKTINNLTYRCVNIIKIGTGNCEESKNAVKNSKI